MNRHVLQMASYTGKSKKDEGKPKRPQSAYFLFLADFRQKMKGKNIDHKEILKLGKIFQLYTYTHIIQNTSSWEANIFVLGRAFLHVDFVFKTEVMLLGTKQVAVTQFSSSFAV